MTSSNDSEHDLLWQPPAVHSDERPRPQTSSRAQRFLNDLASGYISRARLCEVIRWSGLLQDWVVYGAKFSVVFLVEGPCTAFIQEGLDCLGLYHSGLKGERYFPLVVELT